MQFDSTIIGMDLGVMRVNASTRRLLAFAAAIDAKDAPALDDDQPCGLAALPSFCVTLEWAFLQDPDRSRLLGIDEENLSQFLHVGQDSQFHAPIRAGTDLRIEGSLVGLSSVRAGALLTMRIDIRESVVERLLVTSWMTVLCRGASIVGADRVIERPPAFPDAGRAPWKQIEIPVPRGLAHIYAECTGIHNPIHTERRVARQAGLPDIVLQGTATWAIAGQALARQFAAPGGRRLGRLMGEFRAPVTPGSFITLTHDAPVEANAVVAFEMRSAGGGIAIANGRAVFIQ